MKQHGQPQQRFRPNALHGANRMLPHIIFMMRVTLLKPHHRRNFRQNFRKNLRKLHADRTGIRAADDLQQLRRDSFRRDMCQAVSVVAQSLRRLRLYLISSGRCKSKCTQNAQRILLKPRLCVSDTAYAFVFQILFSAKRVAQSAPRTPRHGIDRKIPPREVLHNIRYKRHGIRSAPVRIRAFRAECCDFYRFSVHDNGYRSMLETGFNDMQIGKNLFRLFRCSCRAQIIIMRLSACQPVAHCAADNIAGKSRLFQPLHDAMNLLRHIEICRVNDAANRYTAFAAAGAWCRPVLQLSCCPAVP